MSVPNIFTGYNTMYWPLYIVCLSGVLFQTMLLVCLVKDPLKCFRNSATYLVANLAVCDLIFLLFVTVGAYSSKEPHVRSLSHTSFYSSILTIFCIAVDRYFMVTHPLKHRLMMSGKKAALSIAFIWLLGVASPIYHILTHTLEKISEFKYGFLATIVPLTGIFYALTCVSLKRQARNLANQEGSEAHKSQIEKEKRFLTTVVIVTVIAVVTLTPATIYGNVMQPGLDANMKDNALYCTLMTMLCLNFAVNPCIYYIRLQNYRKTFDLVFCRRRLTRLS